MSLISARPPENPVQSRSIGLHELDSVDASYREPVARLRLLWDQRRFLGRALAVGLVLGIVLSFLLAKQYQSSTQLMAPDTQPNSGLLMALASGGGGGNGGLGALAAGLLGGRSSGEEFVAILRSRTVLDRLVQRFDLKKIYRVKLDEEARKELNDNTTIETDRKSGVISLVVTDRDPQRSRAIAQAYVEELDRLVAELSTSAARRERIFLEGRLSAVKVDLDQAARNFSQFASKSGAIDIAEQGKAMVGSAATLQGESIAVESELKGLEQIYSPNNVRVRTARARLAELQRQLGKLDGQDGSNTSQAPAADDGSTSQYPSIRQLPILGVTYFDLYRQAKIQESVYEALTKEYEMAKVEEAKEIPTVKVLDPPNLPEKKSFPPRLLIVFLCVLVCFIVASSVVLARERWARTEPSHPGKILAQEVLQSAGAAMPWAPPNGSPVQSATHRIWTKLVGPKAPTQASNS